MHIILLTKTTAAQNEVALSYHKVRGLYFLAVVLRRLYTNVCSQELYIYSSTLDEFTLSNSTMLYHVDGLKMGEWYDGPQKDGKRSFTSFIPATTVRTFSVYTRVGNDGQPYHKNKNIEL